MSVLTDIDANRHYCAVLSFNEAVSITPSKPTDEVKRLIVLTLLLQNTSFIKKNK